MKTAKIVIDDIENQVSAGTSLKTVMDALSVPDTAKIEYNGVAIPFDSKLSLPEGVVITIDTDYSERKEGESDGPVYRHFVYKSTVKLANKGGKLRRFTSLPSSKKRRYIRKIVDVKANGESETIWEKDETE